MWLSIEIPIATHITPAVLVSTLCGAPCIAIKNLCTVFKALYLSEQDRMACTTGQQPDHDRLDAALLWPGRDLDPAFLMHLTG